MGDSFVQTKRRVWDILNAGPRNRFTVSGVLAHNCGYQGGKGAFAKMAHNFGAEVTEEEAVGHVQRGRDENPKIVRFWYALEEAARAAVSRPGEVFGVSGNKIMFRRTGRFLHMRLPSGRKLTYLDPEIRDGKLTYMGIDTYTRQLFADATPEHALAGQQRERPDVWKVRVRLEPVPDRVVQADQRAGPGTIVRLLAVVEQMLQQSDVLILCAHFLKPPTIHP